MGVRRRIARTSQEIMESDINICIKKAKVRYRSEKVFYVFKYTTSFFASSTPEHNKEGRIDYTSGYFQKWRFDENKSRWKLEKTNPYWGCKG